MSLTTVSVVSSHSKNFFTDHDRHTGLNNNDQDIELIKQTNTLSADDQTAKEIHPQSNSMIDNSNSMAGLLKSHDDSTPTRSSETSDVIHLTTAVSLQDLLCYQDVMNAIESEFHLHAGEEREIIMKLWLKEQTMISLLQRFRHLLQDLNIDEKDFANGIKQIREIINHANHDIQYFREQSTMLENQNRFLEEEFQRQLDRIVRAKNEQITRLTRMVDQTCSESNEQPDQTKHSTGTEELLEKFMQQNVELQREIETLRAKLEYTFTFANERFNHDQGAYTSVSLVRTAFEQIRRMETNLQEMKFKSAAQQEENDFLKYLIEKSSRTSTIEQRELFQTIEGRSLQREIDRVRQELDMTEKRRVQLEQRFEHGDELAKFHLESLKLKCDVLQKHIHTCSERLNEVNKQIENSIPKHRIRQEQSLNERKVLQVENELLKARERYDEIAEHSNTLKSDLNNLRRQIHEKEKFHSSSQIELDRERRHANQLEHELMALRTKYDAVCERVSAATHQLERVKVVLEETSRRCEQLEKEKSEINVQSAHLSQNVANVTTKYKEKLMSIKLRLEQTERERREVQTRSDQYQYEVERLKDELTYKNEMIFEKEKLIQDAQYNSREILREKQSVEERRSDECKRLNELMDKNHLLQEELNRLHLVDRRTVVDLGTNDSSKQLEELRMKIDEFEKRYDDQNISREALQIQIRILEEENLDLREIMNQMRKRAYDSRRDDRDRNDEIQKLIARAEFNARQYLTHFNISTLSSPSTIVRIVPLSSSTQVS